MAACVVEQSGVRAGDVKQTTDGPFTNNEGTRRSRYLGPLEHRHRPPSPPTPPTAPACIVLPCAGCCAAGSYAEASGHEGAAVTVLCVFVLPNCEGRLRRRIGRGQARGAGRTRERTPRDVRAHPETRTRELALVYQTSRSSGGAARPQSVGGEDQSLQQELLRPHRLYLDCQTKLDGISIKTALLPRTFKFRVSLRMFCLLGETGKRPNEIAI